MVEVKGYFDYRPSVLASDGTIKAGGFTGNTITGTVPIAVWDEPQNAFRMIEGVDKQTYTNTIPPTGHGSVSVGAVGGGADTTEYERPPDDKPKSKLSMLLIVPIVAAIVIIVFVFKRR